MTLTRTFDTEPWELQALCARMDPDLWQPSDYDDPRAYKTARSREAKRLCLTECPVQQQCLDKALRNNEIGGIWGGHDPGERKAIARRRPPQTQPAATGLRMCTVCGTVISGKGRTKLCGSAHCRRKHDAEQQRLRNRPRPNARRACRHCRGVFAGRGTSIYCSSRCRGAAASRRVGERAS